MADLNLFYVIKPITVTDSMLISTTVAETDYAEYSAGTSYALGARVIVAATHKVYESLVASNVGNAPASNPTKWIEVSATNRWKPFDTSFSTQVLPNATTMSYQLRPGIAVTSLAVLNCSSVASLRIRVVDPTYGTVIDRTVSMSSLPPTSDWAAWFFSPRIDKTQTVHIDLPNLPNADIYLDFTGPTTMAVGVILLGNLRTFSMGVKYGAKLGIQDYSVKSKNSFGDTTLTVRAFAKRANFDLILVNSEVDALQNFLTSVRAVPCLWLGTNYYESTAIYGIYKDFSIVLSYFAHSDCSIEIEGLT